MMNDPSLAAVLFNDRRLRLETEARAHSMLRAVRRDERHAARRATAVIVDVTVRLASRRRFADAASGESSAVTA